MINDTISDKTIFSLLYPHQDGLCLKGLKSKYDEEIQMFLKLQKVILLIVASKGQFFESLEEQVSIHHNINDIVFNSGILFKL